MNLPPRKKKQSSRLTTVPSGATGYARLAKDLLTGIKKKRKAPVFKNIRPMLATLVDAPFEADGWSFEIKWDGYRALAWMNGRNSDLRSRNGNSFSKQFFPVYEALKQWPIRAVVDGEVVVINEKGISSFQQLQNWQSGEDGQLLYYVFDIIWLYGYDLTAAPLVERRKILQQLVPAEGIIRFSESFETSAAKFLRATKKLGIEGVIAKRLDSRYTLNNRSKDWLKIKSSRRHEAVVGGYTLNRGSDRSFSSLLFGVYENKKLRFIGQVGTGFNDKSQMEILKKLKPLETRECPFHTIPGVNRPENFRPNQPKASITWVKPELVAEVQYQELTDDGLMRHPSFRGLRTDKKAGEVTMEEPVHIPHRSLLKKSIEKKFPGKSRTVRNAVTRPREH